MGESFQCKSPGVRGGGGMVMAKIDNCITGLWNRAIQESFSSLHEGLYDFIPKISWAEAILVRFFFNYD